MGAGGANEGRDAELRFAAAGGQDVDGAEGPVESGVVCRCRGGAAGSQVGRLHTAQGESGIAFRRPSGDLCAFMRLRMTRPWPCADGARLKTSINVGVCDILIGLALRNCLTETSKYGIISTNLVS